MEYADSVVIARDRWIEASRAAIAALANDASMEETLGHIVSGVESKVPGVIASILVVADSGKHFSIGVAPSLPDFYNAAVLANVTVTRGSGCCGTAAATGERVVATDIRESVLWQDYVKLADDVGIRACWSEPIRDGKGKVLGTFAMYWREPRAPTEGDLDFIENAAHLAGITIVRRQRLAREHEAQHTETRLRHSQKLESLGLLAGGIAHDFNNLLVGILGNAGLALLDMDESDPARRSVEAITMAAHRAGDLARELLAYSGHATISNETLDINTITLEMERLLAEAIPSGGSLAFELAEDLPTVKGDAIQLRQVIMNLITNAAAAIGDTGRIVASTRAVTLGDDDVAAFGLDQLERGRYVALTVRDDGCGIEKENLAKIFDPFFTTKLDGRGLGLAAVHGILRGHGGSIRVESESGTGTTFELVLPAGEESPTVTADVVVVDAVQVVTDAFSRQSLPGPLEQINTAARTQVGVIPAHAMRKPPSGSWKTRTELSGGGTILVVDDEPAVRDLLQRLLGQHGYTPILAADGAEAIELFKSQTAEIDAVILDISMPRMNGEQVLKVLRKIRPDIPVIFSSGYSEDDPTGRWGGTPTRFIAKPFDVRFMLREIRASLGQD